MLPSIDNLRRDVKKIHYFGLGFVQVNVSETARYNFYHQKVPAFVDEPHDHRYSFTSQVLKGSLQNNIWVSHVDGTLIGTLENESCREGVPPSGESVSVVLGLATTSITRSGSRYYMHHDTLHTVCPIAVGLWPTVTYIERGSIMKEYARVFRQEGAAKVCPFSKKMPEDELWDIVAECLRC